MATLVAQNLSTGVTKRYRPAPAKTFQCRGYGECRMVFSRSEHLARHIRKHTGERPFSCHCGKQFSRLDNLRQHAQTVHADKQDQNERMMRDLTSLHATMAAANKAGQPRSKRTQSSSNSTSSLSPVGTTPSTRSACPPNHVKQEDDHHSLLPTHQRPGTSTGYEGDHNGIIYQSPTTWHVQSSQLDRPTSKPTNNHSFRDPGQSFLAPPSSSTSAQHQSFLPFPSSFNFHIPDSSRDGRPGSGSSRPPTSESHPRSLPPLASVVPTSIPPPSSHPSSFSTQQQQQQQHLLQFPLFRKPSSTTTPTSSSATRPGTAPAAYCSSKPPYIGGPGLVSRPELSFLTYGRDLAPTAAQSTYHLGGYDPDLSPSAGPTYDSPFSFHPPALTDPQPSTLTTDSVATPGSPSLPNSRKRTFAGADGPEYATEYDYDYGSESRPQSRRLSVMELCNDQPSSDRPFLLLSSPSSGSRPGTSSGLVSSANALALIDRSPTTSAPGGGFPPLLSGAPQPTASAAPSTSGGETEQFRGGGLSPASRRGLSSSSATAAAATTTTTAAATTTTAPPSSSSVLQSIGRYPSHLSDGYGSRSASSYTSYHPQSPPPFAATARILQSHSKPPSPATSASDVLSRRGGNESQHDQVRISVSAAHTPTAVGMRV